MAEQQSYPIIGNSAITVRAIRITDEAMEADVVSKQSPQSLHYRFIGANRELPASSIKQFCEIEGLHSMAFVATVDEGGQETQIGLSRYAANSDQDTREMAVSVADDWYDAGLDTLLAHQLVEFARGHGITTLYSVDLAGNQTMQDLANNLGMTARRDPDNEHQLIYSMTL